MQCNTLTRVILGTLLIYLAAARWATAQVSATAVDGDDLYAKARNANGPNFIRLDDAGATAGSFAMPQTLVITRSLTIVGSGALATDVRIQAANTVPDNAVIVVDGGATLTLIGVTVQAGGSSTVAVKVRGGSSLSISRSQIEASAPEGITGTGAGGSNIVCASSIFEGAGIRTDNAARVVVMQCNFSGNAQIETSAATADVDVVASLFIGVSNALNGGAADIESWANFFDGGSQGSGVEIKKASPAGPPIYAATSTFTGQLEEPIPFLADLAFDDLEDSTQTRVSALWRTDFQRQRRGEALQVGADEINSAGGGLGSWTIASIVIDDIESEYVGLAGATIYITVNGITMDTNVAKILIATELNGTTSFIELDPEELISGEFYSAFLPIGAGATLNNLPIDGRATIYLRDDSGTLIGDGDDLLVPDIEERSFVIDTIRPRILNSNSADAITFSTSADPPTGASTAPFPDTWAPEGLRFPTNAPVGTLDGPTRPMAFLNAPFNSGTSFSVAIGIADPSPVDVGGAAYDVEVSGFYFDETNNGITTVNNEDIGVIPQFGLPWLQPVVTRIDDDATARFTVDNVLDDPTCLASWSIVLDDADFDPTWEQPFNFRATDRAGNELVEPSETASVFWIREPANRIIGSLEGPASEETDNPVLTADVLRVGITPGAEADPCYPINRVRLWAATNAQLTFWRPVTGWSDWFRSGDVTKNSVIFNGNSLASFLVRPENRGATLHMSVVGADEAGNVQEPPNAVSGNDPVHYTALGYMGANAWINPGTLANFDTQLQALFWHDMSDRGNRRAYDANFEENFQQTTRIPLPPLEECSLRVQGAFNIEYQLPEFTAGIPIAQFELLEDGRLVSRGTIRNTSGSDINTLVIPQDFITAVPSDAGFTISFDPVTPNDCDDNSFSQSFLNHPSPNCGASGCGTRLGDEGNPNDPTDPRRNRDVTYQLSVAVGIDGGAIDTTPATIAWVVTVDNRLGGDNPIKAFGGR